MSDGFYLELTNKRAKILFSIIGKYDKYGQITRAGGTKSVTRLTSPLLNQLTFTLTKNLDKQLRLVKEYYIQDIIKLYEKYGNTLKNVESL